MLVSFLIPTRKQVVMLRDSIGSILRLCSPSHRFEICLAIDSDDTETLEIIPEIIRFMPPNSVKVIITPRKGYARLHEYYNALAEIATGAMLFLWNDDAKMETKHWDIALAGDYSRRDDDCMMLIPQEIHWDNKSLLSGGFPIVTREYYEIVGAFSHSPLNDRYLHDTIGRFAAVTGFRFMMSSVVISHDNNHATHSEVASTLLALHDDPEGEIQKHLLADREALNTFDRTKGV